MKKFLFFLSMLLSLGAISACSSAEDDKDTLIKKELAGVWELKQFNKGWAQITTFESQEVTCCIYDDDIIEVSNKTDVDLSPFLNNGSYSYHLDTSNIIIINGIKFEYSIENDVLRIEKDYSADGECYVFTKTN